MGDATLIAFVAGDTTAAVRRRLFDHIDACVACRRLIAETHAHMSVARGRRPGG